MAWMNEWEIEEAARRYRNHPVLGPATTTLLGLVEAVNRNSDGWAYWRKPIRAAARLMELIERDDTARYRFDDERADVTLEELRKAYVPLKTFRTTTGLQFELHEPEIGASTMAMIDTITAPSTSSVVGIRSLQRKAPATRAIPISLGIFEEPSLRGSA